MKLTNEQKKKIEDEYKNWKDKMYGDNTLKDRQDLGQFFTPPSLTVQMIEKFDNLEGNILDPTCGAGNLLAACIMAGASPDCIYGNELDAGILDICKARLVPLGVPGWHFNNCDALKPEAYEFNEKKKSMPSFGKRRA